jgi:CRP-like cAMP-binding protein
MSRYIQLLQLADIFYQLTQSQLEIVAGLCEERNFQPSEIIFQEGADSDELYIIIEGEVDILVNPSLVSGPKTGKREPVTISTLRRGQSFGEIALVDQGFRSATARTGQSHARLLVLPREKLMKLCEDYPQLGYRLMRNLAADLALKMRTSGLRIREELLYSRREN